jgi:hypothetical protein
MGRRALPACQDAGLDAAPLQRGDRTLDLGKVKQLVVPALDCV